MSNILKYSVTLIDVKLKEIVKGYGPFTNLGLAHQRKKEVLTDTINRCKEHGIKKWYEHFKVVLTVQATLH